MTEPPELNPEQLSRLLNIVPPNANPDAWGQHLQLVARYCRGMGANWGAAPTDREYREWLEKFSRWSE